MNKLVALTVVLLLVIFLFIYVSSQKTLPMFTFSTTPVPSAQPTSVQMKNAIVNLVIKGNKLADGPQALQVTQGQMVILNITADKDDEFHFHGYDKHVILQKGKTVVLSFLATMTGHFEYELENTKTILGAIDVYPQ